METNDTTRAVAQHFRGMLGLFDRVIAAARERLAAKLYAAYDAAEAVRVPWLDLDDAIRAKWRSVVKVAAHHSKHEWLPLDQEVTTARRGANSDASASSTEDGT